MTTKLSPNLQEISTEISQEYFNKLTIELTKRREKGEKEEKKSRNHEKIVIVHCF